MIHFGANYALSPWTSTVGRGARLDALATKSDNPHHPKRYEILEAVLNAHTMGTYLNVFSTIAADIARVKKQGFKTIVQCDQMERRGLHGSSNCMRREAMTEDKFHDEYGESRAQD